VNRIKEAIPPGWRGAFFYAAYWGVVGMFEPYITVHFLRLGFSGEQIGWLAAVFPFFNLFFSPLISRFADWSNRRILVLAVSAIFYGVALIFLPVPVSFLAVLPVFAISTASRSPIVPLADSLIARMAERHLLDFGRMRMWGSAVFTITALGLGVLWAQTGFQVMFTVSGVLFLVVAAAALLLDEAAPSQTPLTINPNVPMRTLPEPGIMFLLAANFLVVGALFMSGTFGTVYMTMIGGTEAAVGALFGLSALAEVPGMLFGRRIARKIGDTKALLAAYLLAAVGFAGFAFSLTPSVMLVFALVRGLGFGLFLVTTITIISHRSPPQLSATYQGMQNALCWGLAPLLGGPISGYIFQSLGPSALFLITSGMTACSMVLILPTFKLWKKTEEPVLHPTV
jgi:MFS transporter, PPP family, 3-phenylpropionic acid transporter